MNWTSVSHKKKRDVGKLAIERSKSVERVINKGSASCD